MPDDDRRLTSLQEWGSVEVENLTLAEVCRLADTLGIAFNRVTFGVNTSDLAIIEVSDWTPDDAR